MTLSETLNWYGGVLVGAYLIIWGNSVGGNSTWRTPIIWVAFWIVYETVAWLIRRAWRRHKTNRPAKVARK